MAPNTLKDINMDLEYLLFLQNNVRCEALNPVMMGISDLAVDMVVILGLFVVYWSLSKKIGYSLIYSVSFGNLLNSILKLSFCIYRPWIRSAEIVPPAVAIPSAGGYSFPSGHSQMAMGIYGTGAYWFWNKKRWVAIALLVLVFFIGFSRNYLGVHTPQDVIVGFSVGLYAIYCLHKLLNNYDRKDKKADLILLVKGILLAVFAVIYFLGKNYPIDYDAAGNMLVDPKKMMIGGFVSAGMWAGFVLGWFIEKYYIDFSTDESAWKLVLRGVIGVVTMYYLMSWLKGLLSFMGPCWSVFTLWFFVTFYAIAIYPAIYKHCHF